MFSSGHSSCLQARQRQRLGAEIALLCERRRGNLMPSHPGYIVTLAGLSALLDIVGTATVWKTFLDTSRFADELSKSLDESEVLELPEAQITYDGVLDLNSTLAADRQRSLTISRSQLKPFRRSRVTELGLACFFVGAILGFVAVCIAV